MNLNQATWIGVHASYFREHAFLNLIFECIYWKMNWNQATWIDVHASYLREHAFLNLIFEFMCSALTCTHTHTHTYIHTYIHIYIHTYIHIHIHKYTNIHTYIHTYIHTHYSSILNTTTASTGWRGLRTSRPTSISPCMYIHTYVHTYRYHFRLDWLAWFAGFQTYQYQPWLVHLALKMLDNNKLVDDLLSKNPFKGSSPAEKIRVLQYKWELDVCIYVCMLLSSLCVCVCVCMHALIVDDLISKSPFKGNSPAEKIRVLQYKWELDVCLYVCMYVCMYVSMSLCVCVCMHAVIVDDFVSKSPFKGINPPVSVCLDVCLAVCLSRILSLCLYICRQQLFMNHQVACIHTYINASTAWTPV
jgi:hypothetical protein